MRSIGSSIGCCLPRTTEDTDSLKHPEPNLSSLNNDNEISVVIESNRTEEAKCLEFDKNQETNGSSSAPAIAGKEPDPAEETAGDDADVAEVSGRKDERLQAESGGNGSCQVVTVAVAARKGGEKKVGTLLAAAMEKYAVPRSSCYHGVTK